MKTLIILALALSGCVAHMPNGQTRPWTNEEFEAAQRALRVFQRVPQTPPKPVDVRCVSHWVGGHLHTTCF